MTDPPACTCARLPGDAHLETCAVILYLRSRPNDDDLEFPAFLDVRKRKPSDNVFD